MQRDSPKIIQTSDICPPTTDVDPEELEYTRVGVWGSTEAWALNANEIIKLCKCINICVYIYI